MTTIVPQLRDIVDAAKTELASSRPSANIHIESGRWGDLIVQWKAECVPILHRLAREVCAARLGLADGQALFDLVASEYAAGISTEPSYAVGHVTLTREGTGTRLPGGLIRTGTRFRKVADSTASPPVKGAEYESSSPVFVPAHFGTGDQAFDVPIRALNTGTDPNVQSWETGAVALADTLFDPLIRVVSGEAAGGSAQYSTAKLRALASALTMGQYGPVSVALVAGALSTPGVAMCVSRSGAMEKLWISDDSWCCSRELISTVRRDIQEKWLGFGCRCEIAAIENERTSIEAKIMLRDKKHIANSEDVTDAIRNTVKSFFDVRPDFHIWDLLTLQAALTRADRRILSCEEVSVKDVNGNEVLGSTGSNVNHYDVDTTNASIEFMWP